ncbi:MAG: glycosyltransferase [Candidatus Electrothrix sp. MAN1_4]|nr:glycosyltransferase [Candidatus Electrothrix sp. MAN1_4]
MKDRKRILFVCHCATRTGAPLILLNFLNWVKQHRSHLSFEILLKDGGPLEKEFKKITTVYRWRKNMWLVDFLDQHGLWGKKKHYILHKLGYLRYIMPQDRLLPVLKKNKYDLVFINSFANCNIIPELAKNLKCPFICRAPELKMIVEDYCGLECVQSSLPYLSHFIAVSDTVKNYFVDGLGISDKNISKIPGFFRPYKKEFYEKGLLKKQLDIPEDAFVVCGCGTINWRKGTDIFIQIASKLKCNTPLEKLFFIWIGGDLDRSYTKEIFHDVEKLGLGNIVKFVGIQKNPQDYFAISDLFAMTSREDPFPLVAMEAASLGLPIICFDNAVGSTEFINDQTGKVVSYLDSEAFGKAILSFLHNREALNLCASVIKQRSNDYSIDNISPKLTKIIEEFCKH